MSDVSAKFLEPYGHLMAKTNSEATMHNPMAGVGYNFTTWTDTTNSPFYFQATNNPTVDDPKFKKEYDMIGLYDVVMVYGEDRAKLIIEKSDGVVAANEEDAKVKSGLMKKVDDKWDADFLTFIVRKIGDIKIKPKPSEVKNV